MESGKWDEELSRMSAIVDRVKPNSLLLFNKSFASTNEREGSEIASNIVKALLDGHVKYFSLLTCITSRPILRSKAPHCSVLAS